MKWMDQWNVAASINAYGWTVEMEIPWEMLDYPDTTEPIRMGINFDRGQVRTGIRSWWSNIGVEESYEKDGHWLHVLPPPKLSGSQGSLDTLKSIEPSEPTELAKRSEPIAPTEPVLGKTDTVSLTPTPMRPTVVNSSNTDIFRSVNASTLNPVDGLRLGIGFEAGRRWYAAPFFFDEKIQKNLRGYLRIARIGSQDQYPGANWVAHFWYPRNLKTFVNLTRITKSEDERILLIIGAGHLGFLKQIVEDSEFYHLESPLEYLEAGEKERPSTERAD